MAEQGQPGQTDAGNKATSATGVVLLTLAAGQFLMTLDSSVMNVSIATVAEDVGTTVTGIQTAITLYTLVMASLMITGGKVGQIIGRKRAFAIGCVIYGCGSFTTAIAPNLAVLIIGWSFLEGIGAALIMPAIVALVASNFARAGTAARLRAGRVGRRDRRRGRPADRRPLHDVSLVALVFAGEVIVVLGDPRCSPGAWPTRRPSRASASTSSAQCCPHSGSGSSSTASSRSGTWGFVQPEAGRARVARAVAGRLADPRRRLVLLALPVVGEPPVAAGASALVDPAMLRNRRLRGGLTAFFFQYLLQAGLFFTVPLFLSVALGLSAIDDRRAAAAALDHAPAGRRRHPQAVPERVAASGRPVGFLALVRRPRGADRRARSGRRGRRS